MSGTYCNDDTRTLILETLAWSFTALSTLFYMPGFTSEPINFLIEAQASIPLKTHGAVLSPSTTTKNDGRWAGSLLLGHT